jgi:hypothetical protein
VPQLEERAAVTPSRARRGRSAGVLGVLGELLLVAGAEVYTLGFPPSSRSLWLRIAAALVLVTGGLVLMVQFLFSWMAQFTQFTDSTIGSASNP